MRGGLSVGELLGLDIAKSLVNLGGKIATFVVELPIWLSTIGFAIAAFVAGTSAVNFFVSGLASMSSSYPIVWCFACAMGVVTLLEWYVKSLVIISSVLFFIAVSRVVAVAKTAALDLIKL